MTRRYTDREVALIIRRALEPETEGRSLTGTDADLTLEEIKEIAAEVGIGAHRIEQAAALLARPEPAPVNPYAGIPTAVTYQSTVPSRRLHEVPVEEVVATIRSTLGRQGILVREAGQVEWKARDVTGGRYVSITSHPEGIHLSVLGNFRDALLSIVAGAAIPTFVGVAVLLSGLGLDSAGTLLGAAAMAVIPPRFLYRWWRKKEDATIAALNGKLMEILRRPTTEPTPNTDSE
jgi:hypothetical protein